MLAGVTVGVVAVEAVVGEVEVAGVCTGLMCQGNVQWGIMVR